MNKNIQSDPFSRDQINKIGNAIVFYSQRVVDLEKVKILQLLFLTEEVCIKKFGHYFFGIAFELWRIGPVVKDIYIDLSENEPILLKDFIKRDIANDSSFIANTEFNDDEFSDNELDLMQEIINSANEENENYLANRFHCPNSLWHQSAVQYGLLEILENNLVNSTNYTVDFNLLFDNNSDQLYLKERFENSTENLEYSKHLKR